MVSIKHRILVAAIVSTCDKNHEMHGGRGSNDESGIDHTETSRVR